MTTHRVLSNPLGDVRAESDHAMLALAFFETPDYLTLLESDEKVVVIGRRGTGKSALTYKLQTQWSSVKTNTVILVAPDEHHTLALRAILPKLGTSFLPIKASVRLLWKYGLIMAAAQGMSSNYKLKSYIAASPTLIKHLHLWGKADQPFFDKLRAVIKRNVPDGMAPEEVIGQIADSLDISQIERELQKVLPEGERIKILVDRLDEGFEPDSTSIAFVDGMISAAIDIASSFRGKIRPVVFLRDNMFRAVADYDQDYSRNIEAFTLRLHWDVSTLFYFVTSRLRAAFGTIETNTKRVWNRHTEFDLQDEDGFKKCLTLTLYRPRDILILLNSAFESGKRRHPDREIPAIGIIDLEQSAKIISSNRLDDLRKEYRHIFHSVDAVTQVFSHGSPELTVSNASELLDTVFTSPPTAPEIQQELAIFQHPEEMIRSLYSIGFLGVHDSVSGTFLFCHDGKKPDIDLKKSQRILIHPCYWMALSLSRSNLNPEEAAQINDEYEIKVLSITPAIRQARLGKLISEFTLIKKGIDGAAEFERWCLEACRISFAGRLENMELHPNKNTTNLRDIVGTNTGTSVFWKRVREDYGTRQVIFEVKNYEELTQTDYRQVLSYLSGQYGNIAFIISRDDATELERGKELAWFKTMYNEHKKMIIKLTGKYLSHLLAKQRNPQKHDAADTALATLLDTYERVYLGQATAKNKKRSAVKTRHP
ncbi:MAG: ATP-binding protein [bacterium]|nr:ATP-binding protein [bacterium]